MVQFTPNSVCFCPWYSSRLTLCVFLSMVQFTHNSACVSVRGTVLCVCFCPWFSSLLALYVFLSVVQFCVCVSVRGSIFCVCFCPWYHSLCVFLSLVQFPMCVSVRGTVPDWLKACQAFGILGVLAMAASLACALLIFFMNEQKIFSLLAPLAAAVGGQYRRRWLSSSAGICCHFYRRFPRPPHLHISAELKTEYSMS